MVLDNAGLEKNITNLSYMEKRLIIVVALLQQTKEAQGDWGRTIESVANQMRIFQQQTERLTRALGNMFLPILKTILPYINAFVMVLTEIVNWLAILLGYDPNEFDYFGGGVSEDAWDFSDALESSSENAKKLKSGLRSFDKLNNITSPSTSSSGSGTGAGGLDADILKLFNEESDKYLNTLDKVEMKATKIRDSIMDWLGFTKKTNIMTGEVSFEYDGLNKTLKNVWKSFKNLTTTGKILVSLGLVLMFKNLFNTGTKLVKILGTSGLTKTISSLVSPLKSLYTNLDKVNYANKSFMQGTAEGISSWSKSLTFIDRLKVSLIGAGGLLISLELVNDALENITEQGKLTTSSLLELSGGVLGLAGSGALLGAQFGPAGAVIGGVAGALLGLLDIYMNYPNQIDITNASIQKSIDKTNEYVTSLQSQYKTIDDLSTQELSLQTAYENLANELYSIVDANGEVKKGYEDRANFIVGALNKAYNLEIEIIDGKIKNYEKEKESIENIISEKKKQILLEASEEKYKIALQERANSYEAVIEAQNNVTKATQNQKKAQQELEEAERLASTGKTYYIVQETKKRKKLEEANKVLENAINLEKSATKAYEENVKSIANYTGLLSSDVAKDQEAVNYYMNEIEKSFWNGANTSEQTQNQMLDDALMYYSTMLSLTKEQGGKINETLFLQAEERLRNQNTSLSELTNSIKGELGENVINAWGTLAETSESKFIEEFSKLNDDVKTQIADKMKPAGYNISEKLQEGINQLKPKITISADIDNVKTKLNNVLKPFKSIGKLLGIDIPTFANGGLPPVGQLFVANEKGPELVGQIGGQTFVANQNQMLDLLNKKISNSNNSSKVFNIYLDEEHKLGTYTLDQLQDMARSNGEPITIG